MVCLTSVIMMINGAIFQKFKIIPYNQFKTNYILREYDIDDNLVSENLISRENAMFFETFMVESASFECESLGNRSNPRLFDDTVRPYKD